MRYADTVTLAGGAAAGISLVLASIGLWKLAVKVLLIAFLADVIDGWVARNIDSKRGLGSSPEGQMLDRSLDRVTQVVVPLVILSSIVRENLNKFYLILLIIYASIILPVSFYRLVYRVRRRLDYFPGTPLFVHASIVIGLAFSGEEVTLRILLILILAAIGTGVSIPYMRRIPDRRGRASNPSPALIPRILLILILIFVPYGNPLSRILGKAILSLAILYLGLGWIPPLLLRREVPSVRVN